MRTIVPLLLALSLLACNHASNEHALQTRIDSLESKLANTYKPGFGEFMSSIQVHHAKLWFAGQSQNWKLADFEINEIKESLEGIKEYCTDRTETKSIDMIAPSMDSLSNAIEHQDMAQFNKRYLVLTSNCNNCHHATNHAFNVIKVPSNPPFSNQDFK